MSKYQDKIAITTGDVNGIGAEITIKALNKLDLPEDKIVLISSKNILDYYGKLKRNYEVIEIPYFENIEPGKITSAGGEFSFLSLKKVCELNPKAIVTAPVSKEALHIAGHNFNGQTEVLQHFLAHGNQKAEMLFLAKDFRVLLLTRHCSLKNIMISTEMVVEKIKNLKSFFETRLGIKNPKFALCGLNPHAGEHGVLGDEEIKILRPAVDILKSAGIDITNPLPSDTLFIKAGQAFFNHTKQPYDCYIAMYHDQGLIPIKTVAGAETVNMTIGLDIIRTSPGHGTAFDIAGKNLADETGMISAISAVL